MKLSLYLETSVIGAYLDNGDPFRRDLTIRWFEHELSEYQAYSSILVQRELERVDEPHRTGYLKIIEGMERLELAEEVAILAEGYISRGIFHRKFIADAVHMALGLISQGRLSCHLEFRPPSKCSQAGPRASVQRGRRIFLSRHCHTGVSRPHLSLFGSP